MWFHRPRFGAQSPEQVWKVTHDVTQWTPAKFLSDVGKRTELFARFSTVGGEKGSADAERDPRGFAVKLYAEEGNCDMVGKPFLHWRCTLRAHSAFIGARWAIPPAVQINWTGALPGPGPPPPSPRRSAPPLLPVVERPCPF